MKHHRSYLFKIITITSYFLQNKEWTKFRVWCGSDNVLKWHEDLASEYERIFFRCVVYDALAALLRQKDQTLMGQPATWPQLTQMCLACSIPITCSYPPEPQRSGVEPEREARGQRQGSSNPRNCIIFSEEITFLISGAWQCSDVDPCR